jgi:hypothetical protein
MSEPLQIVCVIGHFVTKLSRGRFSVTHFRGRDYSRPHGRANGAGRPIASGRGTLLSRKRI